MTDREKGVLSMAECVEALMLYGVGPDPLGPDSRAEIVDWAIGFEECTDSSVQLHALSDRDLVSRAYWVMVEYTRGMR